MNRFLPLISLFSFLLMGPLAHGQNNNGTIDLLEELVSVEEVMVDMPDGTRLATDVYLPITGDSLVLPIPVPGLGTVNLEVIPKGMQYMYYPELNGGPNPNPYQLPFVFTRTTYNKTGGTEFLGAAMCLLGYGAVIQDTRGVFASEGVFFPLMSDGWAKFPYMQEQVPIDVFGPTDPSSVLQHEDGIHSLDFVLNHLNRPYDVDDDGSVDFTDAACNGSVGMLGASALAIPQYQLSAAAPIDPNGPGLKGLLNLIASNEHYNHTVYNNGVFREKLVQFWIRGQMDAFSDANLPLDSSRYNAIHTALDYGIDSIESAIDSVLDFLTEYQFGDSLAAYYPNSPFRSSLDASYAPLNASGAADINGDVSRYTHAEVPQYHFSGWYDIFCSGQIASFNNLRSNLSQEADRQYLVLGPWAHTTIATQTTGDVTYPDNVGDIMGATLDINNFDPLNLNVDVDELFKNEVLSWLRTTLNYNSHASIGEPQIRFPESNRYQEVLPNTLVRLPASDYTLQHADLINFLGGFSALPGMPIEIYNRISINLGFFTFVDTISLGTVAVDIPALPVSVFDLLGGLDSAVTTFPATNDFSTTPPVRAYIIGPQDDGVSYNDNAGNYWMARDSFPFQAGIRHNRMFFHGDGSLTAFAPVDTEDTIVYQHNPDNPVLTVGGHNMLIDLPNGEESRGQMNLANPTLDSLTRSHPGVVSFTSEVLTDTFSFVGFPKVKLFASSLPDGANAGDPTDTDFMVRLVDVYPDGRELYVTEGVVNARARQYAKSIAEGAEDVQAPFTNIASDSVYAYYFDMLPVGYTFGKEHRVKLLVSSSNSPKYQVNPNIPIEEGEFFRRPLGSDESYTYQGTTYSSRIATQSIHSNPVFAGYVTFPVFGKEFNPCLAADSLRVDSLSATSASLSWSPVAGASAYRLVLNPGLHGAQDTLVVYGTHFTLDSLQPETVYTWQIQPDCSASVPFTAHSFTTSEFCIPLDSLWLVEAIDSSWSIAWNQLPFTSEYLVRYGIDSLNNAQVVSDTSFSLPNALSDTLYTVVVKPNCDSILVPADTLFVQTLLRPFIDTLSVQSQGDLAEVDIRPNPTDASFTLSSNALFKEVYIVDGLGRMVSQKQWDNGKREVRINGERWSSGIYFVRVVFSDNESTVLKLTVK